MTQIQMTNTSITGPARGRVAGAGIIRRVADRVCPPGASCRQIAARAAAVGVVLVPAEIAGGQAITGADGLGLAGPVIVAAVSPLLLAATAAVSRWAARRRWQATAPAGDLLTGSEAAAREAAAWRRGWAELAGREVPDAG